MKVHFIAIGGAAMHNLALALHLKGYEVSGSDDAIFDPSKSRLKAHGLLPQDFGWYPEKITSELDAIVLVQNHCSHVWCKFHFIKKRESSIILE